MTQPGLCGTCRHAQAIRTATSVFLLCGRHRAEPDRYRKYPPLPVLRCVGYDPADAQE